MTNKKAGFALQELSNNILDKDPIKARLVLSHFQEYPATEQEKIVEELTSCTTSFCIPLLVFLASTPGINDKWSQVLTQKVLSKAMEDPAFIIEHLPHKNIQQPFFIDLAADLRLLDAIPALHNILLGSTDRDVLQGAIRALGRIGQAESIKIIGEMLYSDTPVLIQEAAEALGQIATPAAMHRLVEKLGQDEGIDFLIIDIFARVQSDLSLHKLNELMHSRSAHLRNYIKEKIITIGLKAVPMMMANLTINDPDTQIHSLNVLQEIADGSAAGAVRKLINTHPKDANVRFAAYETLTSLPGVKGDYVLASGLLDPEDNVRLAAAKAIDRCLDDVLTAGIGNMINQKDAESVRIIKVVIDAQAENIFLRLIDNDFFTTIALGYLRDKAHPDTRLFFDKLLKKHGHKKMAKGLKTKKVASDKLWTAKACAVDDSPMILNIYKSVLNELHFEPVLFQEPENALTWLEHEKPLFVCTDLNMPVMNGIDLIKHIRRQYNKDELPVILVTTQNDQADNTAAYEAGANAILNKPFDSARLDEVLHEILPH